MKIIYNFILIILLSFQNFELSAQFNIIGKGENGGEFPYEKNDANNPCITDEQYDIIEKRCNENAKLYINSSSIQSRTIVTLNWPLKAKAGFSDCGYYFISAHVDHDNAATTFKDHNCGSITYDGHKGTDIAVWPFPFYKMDNNHVEVIAAATGTILDKHDGETDRNCVGAGSNITSNYVVIQHSDGSRTLYLHMKNGSITSKSIGQAINDGEHVGVVGSSGSSSGPHLHFEVWAGSTVSTLVDPFSGTCNLMNASSYWAVQKPYTEPAVLKASVHTTDYTAPACGTTETSNESTSYTIPFQGAGLSAGFAKFYIFARNVTNGGTVSMSIVNPNSTVFNSWNHTLTATATNYYWGFSRMLPTLSGTYTFNATYNGITCSQSFDIISGTPAPTGIAEENAVLKNMVVYPNPFNSSATIQFNQRMNHGELTIYNEYGQNVQTIKNISGQEIKINRNYLQSGLYLIRLTEDDQLIQIAKLQIAD